MLATASAGQFGRAMRILLADPNVDSLLTIFIPPLVTAAADVAAAMTDAARTAAKPVLATFMSVEGAIPMLAPIPCYRFPEAAVAALGTCDVLWRVAPNDPPARRRIFDAEVAAARPVLAEALARGSGWLTPSAAQQVLQSMGIPVVPAQAVANSPDAVSAARNLGYPVALKGFGPTILHKSDVGAVKLRIENDDAARAGLSSS